MSKKTVLITGVAGFVGSNLAERLIENNFRVVGIDNFSCGIKEQIPDEVDFHMLDIRKKEIYPLFRNVDAVFHLAAKNCINDCQKEPVETSDINITGSVNVFEAARQSSVKKIIYAESSALYEGNESFPSTENEIHPNSFYARSKHGVRLFAEAFSHFHKQCFTALRYFCVYGPKQDYRRSVPPVISAFIIKLLNKEPPIIYGNGKKRRDFVYVDDLNDFHMLCLDNSRTDGQTYNIGSGKNYSVIEIYDIIEEFLKTGIRPEYRDNLPAEAETTLADISKAESLGWEPKTDIRKGIEKSIDFIRKNPQILKRS